MSRQVIPFVFFLHLNLTGLSITNGCADPVEPVCGGPDCPGVDDEGDPDPDPGGGGGEVDATACRVVYTAPEEGASLDNLDIGAISILFEAGEDLDPTSVAADFLTISPPVAGSWRMQENPIDGFTFVLEGSLEPNTDCVVTVQAGIHHQP